MIRHATNEDIFDILILAKQFCKEAPDTYVFNKDKVETWIKAGIENDHMCMLVYEDDTGDIQGGILGVVSEMFMSGESLATEFAWFMSKEHRGGTGAIRLVKAFEEWAKENNAKYIVMADLVGLQDLSKLYERRGFELAERSFIKEI